MAQYYAIERSPSYLAHHGVKGMRWGVINSARKAIASGNQSAINRSYKHAQRKLNKLEKRANNGSKYARRAAALSTGALAAGGFAAFGRGIPSKITRSNFGNIGKSLNGSSLSNVGKSLNGSSISSIGSNLDRAKNLKNSSLGRLGESVNKGGKGLSGNTIARIGAGIAGAGLAVGAGYNAYRAATTKRAAKKAAQFRSEMNKTFKGASYATGGNRQGKKRK